MSPVRAEDAPDTVDFMWFLDVKTMPGVLLTRTMQEARIVWRHVANVPGLRASSVQDDHLHVAVGDAAGKGELERLLRVLHVALNRHRVERGPLWDPAKVSIRPSSGLVHERRKTRYCSLNPCRTGHKYVEDPLEWPWSTHRDLVGLTLVPVVRPLPDPEGFQRYCTRDSELQLPESHLPRDPGEGKIPGLTFQELLPRVAALLRATEKEVLADCHQRRFLLGVARELLDMPVTAIARAADVHRSTVIRAPDPSPDQLRIARTVARDPRFYPWTEELYRSRVLHRHGRGTRRTITATRPRARGGAS